MVNRGMGILPMIFVRVATLRRVVTGFASWAGCPCHFAAPFLLVTLLMLPGLSFAQVPDKAQLDADLAGKFKTSAAKLSPAKKHKTLTRLEQLMFRQARYQLDTLKPWEGTTGALSMTRSGSGEHDIRPNTHSIFSVAVMVRCIETAYPNGISREECLEKIKGILQFVLRTHRAGGVKCANGKQWFNQWQSALWANAAGKGCWLIWDKLDPELQWLAASMICDEADRFVGKPPPAQVRSDTKAEENAWNSTVISLAACMFPNHPNHAKWRETAITWAISSFARESDLKRTDLIDGKPLKDWLVGASIHEDYSLENHDRVHPDYMHTINQLLNQIEVYEWAGLPPPQALTFNTTGVYSCLKQMACPDGGYIYPGGQDWGLHRNPHWYEAHLMQAIRSNDPQAARLAENCLDCGERMMARTKDGGVFLPEEYSFPSTQHYALEMWAEGYLLIAANGPGADPTPEEKLWTELAGMYLYEAGEFGILRTAKTISSFSWGRQQMGLTFPLSKDLLLAPNERSMIGMVNIEGEKKGERPKTLKSVLSTIPGALAVSGILDRGAGRLEQRYGFVALKDGRTIYVDSVGVTSDTRGISLQLGTLSVLNDPHWVHHDASRTLYFENGNKTFNTLTDTPVSAPLELKSPWYNVDDKLGILCLQTSGRQLYNPNTKMGNGRLEQLFHLNSIGAVPKDETSAGQLSPTVLVYYPAQKNEATKAASKSVRLKHEAGSPLYQVTLEDGVALLFDLEKLSITHSGPNS